MLVTRPMTVPFPNVWAKFERTRDGKIYKFEIREAAENELGDLLNFMEGNFMKEETWNSAVGIAEDPLAVEEFRILFSYIISFNYHLVCFDITDPDNPKIAGCNALMHVTKGEELTEEKQFKSGPITKILELFDEVKKAKDLFEAFGVTEYLNGAGLSTDPAYRGMGIATEVLKARDPMCKAFGFKVTAAAFTGISSQKIAEKTGYKTICEFDYAELGTKMNVNFGNKTKSCKIMVLTYFE